MKAQTAVGAVSTIELPDTKLGDAPLRVPLISLVSFETKEAPLPTDVEPDPEPDEPLPVLVVVPLIGVPVLLIVVPEPMLPTLLPAARAPARLAAAELLPATTAFA